MIAFIHTEVVPSTRARASPAAYISGVDAARVGLGVLPFCPFVRDIVRREFSTSAAESAARTSTYPRVLAARNVTSISVGSTHDWEYP